MCLARISPSPSSIIRPAKSPAVEVCFKTSHTVSRYLNMVQIFFSFVTQLHPFLSQINRQKLQLYVDITMNVIDALKRMWNTRMKSWLISKFNLLSHNVLMKLII